VRVCVVCVRACVFGCVVFVVCVCAYGVFSACVVCVRVCVSGVFVFVVCGVLTCV